MFVASLIPQTSKYVKETRVADGILNNTPVLSHATKNLNKTITEVYDLAKNIDKESDKDTINKETLNIMIKYGIVSGETVNNLIESGKIDSKVFADLDGEYKGSIE